MFLTINRNVNYLNNMLNMETFSGQKKGGLDLFAEKESLQDPLGTCVIVILNLTD